MPYSDDDDYDLGNGPPMPRQTYDWYQKNASPIGDMARQEYERRQQNPQRYVPQTPDYPLQPIANIPSKIYGALDWAGRNVAAPSLGHMADAYDTDWSHQPFIGVGEHGEFTGRLPALSSTVAPYLLGAAPAGQGVLPAGVKLPGGKYGYPEGLEGGYHGTHTVFAPAPENQLGQFMDKFINTGEGAQAFGYGHYVGAKKGTGASYMPDAETVLHIGDQPWNPFKSGPNGFTSSTAEQTAHDLLMDAPRIVSEYGHVPDIERVMEDLKDSITEVRLQKHYSVNDDLTQMQIDAVKQAMAEGKSVTNAEGQTPEEVLAALEGKKGERIAASQARMESDQKTLDFIETNQDKFKFETPGSLYHVEIKPPEESLMHWDKKLTEQEPEVIDKMRSIVEKYAESNHPDPVFTHQDRAAVIDQLMNSTGGEAYKRMKSAFQHDRPELTGNGQALSEAMKEAGIPGLRFADQQSRPVFQAKEGLDRTNANIKLLTRILDEDTSPAALADPTRQRLIRELETEKISLENWQNMLKPHLTLQIDGQTLSKPEHVPQLAKNDRAKAHALEWLFDTRDVDKAIGKLQDNQSRIARGGDPNSHFMIENKKAIEWLENNRDKITFKEPDITHNYVIFDPKNLNPVHRERNMPKGYI